MAALLQEILHEYAWDSDSCNSIMGMSQSSDSFVIKSNLVILFSPILRSFKFVSEFFNVELNDGSLRDGSLFHEKFCGVFESVSEGFASKDIHFVWVDVRCEVGCVGVDESEVVFEFFRRGIKGLGWGFCSSDSIVLGSALVPFGLIYPRIGVSPKVFGFNACCKRVCAQLSLEILDVSEKPLECKCCDLELINLDVFSRFSQKFMDLESGSCERREMVLEDFGGGVAKLHVKAVQMHGKGVKFEGPLSDPILVRELSRDVAKDQKENCSEFFEDNVLQMLGIEMGEFVSRNSTPIWQILLSFLYREGYWALVSLSKGDGNLVTGILKPFTVSSALLFIAGDQFHPPVVAGKFDGVSMGQVVKKTENEAFKQKINLSHTNGLIGSQSGHSPFDKCAELGGCKRKKKRSSNTLKELTWRAFCKAAQEDFQIDLEEVYFSRGCNQSKKLKFLKCWMKQIKKSSYCSWAMPDSSNPCQDIPKEVHDRLNALPQESEQPVTSCASIGEDSLTGASRIQDEAALDFHSGTLESFFSDLPHKIQQGLESEEVDLGTLAERLVNASIYWLYQKCEKETTSENQTTGIKSGSATASVVAIELAKLLLREPKDLAAMYKDSDASNPSFAEATSENIARVYELQILFRMEILQSEVGASIGESTKHRFVKHICLLLETIQCHLKGGFFGDWSLDAYVGKIINNRYCQSLGGVVHKIYEKMDLLLFSEEDELPNSVLNSEDSNQTRREEIERDKTDDNNRINDSVSAEDESLRHVENEFQSPQGMSQEEHARKLIEAQARRQRARRFASFTSWVPDLQRVWAPKQPTAMKMKSDPLRKLAKRKERRRVNYDVVLDTPMTGNKGGINSDDRNLQAYGTSLCGSVSKALFQDDDSS